jgi:DNA-binding MarR family transcriptional regulator
MSVAVGMNGIVCDDDGWATGWDVITAVRRSQHRIEVFMDESLEPLGMSFAQYRALESISTNNEIHLSELARLLRLSRQAVQVSARKLERADLVDLTREPRCVYAKLSTIGRRRLELCRRFTLDLKAGIEERLTGGERHRLTRLLGRADPVLESPRRPEWWLAP